MPVAALKDATVVAEGDDGEVGEVTIATRFMLASNWSKRSQFSKVACFGRSLGEHCAGHLRLEFPWR